MSRAGEPNRNVQILEPSRGWAALNLREVWRSRELLLFLAWRDIKVRYKQTWLGVAWTVVQPIVTVIVFTVIFGGLAKLPSEGVPYAAFSFAALIPWTLFAGALTRTSNSMLSNTNLFTKVYFPRLLIPIGSVIPNLVDFGISLAVLSVLLVWFRIRPGWAIVLLPVFIAFAIISALSLGLWFAALNVRFRDVQFLVPFIVQIGVFMSPIVYPASLVSGPLRILLYMNPMTLVIQGFRWALLGSLAPTVGMLVSVPLVAAILVSGLFYFRRVERSFVDVV